MRNKNLLYPFLLFIAVLIGLSTVKAAPGDLDLTFSHDGKLHDSFVPGGDDSIFDSKIQPDGKIVVVGDYHFGQVTSCAVSRYNPNGTLDASFDFDGKALFPTGLECRFFAVALQADGKIIAAGRIGTVSNDTFILARYLPNGVLDTTFDGDGIVRTFIGSDDMALALAIQPDGKIIAAGESHEGGQFDNFALVRYNPDGSLDQSFDNDGKVTTHFSGFSAERINDMILQPDGKIVGVGTSEISYALARYNQDGSLDSSFGTGGKVLLTIPTTLAGAAGVAIQPDGKLVIAGFEEVPTVPPNSQKDFALARFNPDGSLDSTFDNDGRAILSRTGSNESASSVVLQPDGRIVIAGHTAAPQSPQNTDIALARFNSDGSLDNSFELWGATGGTGIDFASAISLQADGKIVAAGAISDNQGSDHAVLRYNLNGSLDPSFGSGGIVKTNIGSVLSFAGAVATQADGKFVVGGFTAGVGFTDFALSRYNDDGTLDVAFGSSGKVVTPLPGRNELEALTIQPDGKIVAVGWIKLTSTTPSEMLIVRYNANGTLDTTFDGDGSLILDLGIFTTGNGVVIQPDGKIVIAADVTPDASGARMTLIRLNPNGSLDTTFDLDGVAMATGLSDSSAFAVALQPDGKIVAVGRAANGVNYDFAVIRHNPDGSPDASFDLDGKIVTPMSNVDNQARAVAIQPDGKIIAGGHIWSPQQFALVRYNPDGSLDTSFDFDGKLTTQISSELGVVEVALQTNGKIIAAGSSGDTDFTLIRYNPNGSLDNTFSGDGQMTFDFWGTSTDRLRGMVLDSRGRAIVVGEASGNFAVARVLGDFVPGASTPFDFDGDRKADAAVYRPSSGVWYQLFSSGIPYGSPTFGLAGDIPVPADYDGDGKTDLAIFRPSSGDWWYRASTDGSLRSTHWGTTGDVPLPADINGDGTDDFVIFRPSNSVWYRISTTGTADQKQFGLSGDKPVIGDFDGDGKADEAIFRPSTGDWWYSASSAGGAFRATHWGLNGDIPAPADFDGDGKTDMAVFRPSNGVWYVLKSSDLSYIIIAFGLSGDRPVPADYDGDGRADIAVFRPSTGVWYMMQSTAGTIGFNWGVSTDVAIPNAFVQQ